MNDHISKANKMVALPSAEEIARVLRPAAWARCDAAGVTDSNIGRCITLGDLAARRQSIDDASAILALVEPAFAAQAAEVTRLREEYEALSYIAAAAMADRDKLRGELDQLRAVYAAQVERTVVAESSRYDYVGGWDFTSAAQSHGMRMTILGRVEGNRWVEADPGTQRAGIETGRWTADPETQKAGATPKDGAEE